MSRRAHWLTTLLALASTAGCSSSEAADALSADRASALLGGSLVDTPWPSDVFLSNGHLAVPSLPLDGRAGSVADLSLALSELDGFPVVTSVFFPTDGLGLVDGALEGKAEIVDLTDGAEETGTVVETGLYYRESTRQIVALRPAATLLREKHRYACLLDGAWVTPSQPMADALAGRGPNAAAYAPLAAFLSKTGRAASSIGAATVFTVGEPSRMLDDMVLSLDSTPAPTATVTQVMKGAALDDLLGTPTTTRSGLGDPAGVVHEAIGAVVLGTFASPYFLDAPADKLGRIATDAAGAPLANGTTTIPFALALPKDTGAGYAKTRVLIFQHGLNASRSQILAVANDYARAGYATLGVDALWHGDRLPGKKDVSHNFTGAAGPDGFADGDSLGGITWFFDIGGDATTGVDALDGRYVRDNFRQGVLDLSSEVRLLAEGDLSAIAAADPALASFSVDATRLVYSGESFGSILGAELLGVDRRLSAGVLSVGGAGIFLPIFPDSPYFVPLAGPLLRPAFDSTLDFSSPAAPPGETEQTLSLIQAAIGPGDPSSFAAKVARFPDQKAKSVLLLMAFSDELIPNQGGELLGAGFGATAVTLPTGTHALRYADLPTAAAPFSGANGVTAAVVCLDPAEHSMFSSHAGQRKFTPGFPPMKPLPKPIAIDNPTETAHALATGFADTLWAGGTAGVVVPK